MEGNNLNEISRMEKIHISSSEEKEEAKASDKQRVPQ